ncbi:hypothetical protein QCA50_000631 [Cerrena zonata]|uniref:WW domain-containing protein n=1 Tax=Cerrena zonata TaxID=2478898 RepID=A0AAW0GR78_9APHY
MSAPFVPMTAPPLPTGWTEHISPTGQPYYHNAITKQSTYARPMPDFASLAHASVPAAQPKKKKEKPLVKTPIQALTGCVSSRRKGILSIRTRLRRKVYGLSRTRSRMPCPL